MDPTEENEENTITVQVSAEMSREAVVEKILELVGSGKAKAKKDKTCGIL